MPRAAAPRAVYRYGFIGIHRTCRRSGRDRTDIKIKSNQKRVEIRTRQLIDL